MLAPLHASASRTPAVDNLLAQAYLGDGQAQAALSAFTEAAAASPKDEKLYAYMADACTDHQNYAMGLKVASLGSAAAAGLRPPALRTRSLSCAAGAIRGGQARVRPRGATGA